MKSVRNFQTPDELELLEFFGNEPVEAVPNDGYWMYEVTDSIGATLRFSMSTHERSVQTSVWCAGAELVVVSCEGAYDFHVTHDSNGAFLRGSFLSEANTMVLELRVLPQVSVRWTSLLG